MSSICTIQDLDDQLIEKLFNDSCFCGVYSETFFKLLAFLKEEHIGTIITQIRPILIKRVDKTGLQLIEHIYNNCGYFSIFYVYNNKNDINLFMRIDTRTIKTVNADELFFPFSVKDGYYCLYKRNKELLRFRDLNEFKTFVTTNLLQLPVPNSMIIQKYSIDIQERIKVANNDLKKCYSKMSSQIKSHKISVNSYEQIDFNKKRKANTTIEKDVNKRFKSYIDMVSVVIVFECLDGSVDFSALGNKIMTLLEYFKCGISNPGMDIHNSVLNNKPIILKMNYSKYIMRMFLTIVFEGNIPYDIFDGLKGVDAQTMMKSVLKLCDYFQVNFDVSPLKTLMRDARHIY